jgi:hypothetical protein
MCHSFRFVCSGCARVRSSLGSFSVIGTLFWRRDASAEDLGLRKIAVWLETLNYGPGPLSET